MSTWSKMKIVFESAGVKRELFTYQLTLKIKDIYIIFWKRTQEVIQFRFGSDIAGKNLGILSCLQVTPSLIIITGRQAKII